MAIVIENSNSILPDSVVKCIKDFIEEMWEKYQIKKTFFNPLLREDIFPLLEKFCIVVYYPLENETNNGFHIADLPFSDGKKDVVYINTNQEMEKQIFTAAHELGHIWNLDEYVVNHLDIELDLNATEKIMNRFAAELMIPEKYFIELVENTYGKSSENIIGAKDFIRFTAFLMSEFFVPYKSILWRFYELEIINEETFEQIIPNDNEKNPLKLLLMRYLEVCIKEDGYNKLLYKSKKKWINEFTTYLKIVEQKGNINPEKIALLKEKFDIPTDSIEIPNNEISLDNR